MYKDRTEKRQKYYDTVMHLHFVEGYGEDRIAKILPIGHTTVNRWIANFVAENKNSDLIAMQRKKRNTKSQKQQSKQQTPVTTPAADEVEKLKAEIDNLRKALDYEKLRAEAYNTMIDIAEKKFSISIRKKRGAKQ
jgi:transposase